MSLVVCVIDLCLLLVILNLVLAVQCLSVIVLHLLLVILCHFCGLCVFLVILHLFVVVLWGFLFFDPHVSYSVFLCHSATSS